MNIRHHPSEELLLDYASGAMIEAYGVAVATHAALCPVCRAGIGDLEAIGGMLLETVEPVPLATATPTLPSGIAPSVARHSSAPASPSARAPRLPQPLRDYLGGDIDDLHWTRIGLGAFQIVIPTSEQGATARLLRIPAGRPVPAHTHGGLELTLVLAGAFSDATGTYARGDLQEADETLRHQPHAAPGEDCVCLAVTDAPLRFSSLPARILQPLIGL